MRRLLHLAVIIALLAAPFLSVQSAYAALNWVGDMWPAGGSVNAISAGGSFDVYVQAYKPGVTEPAGPGAGITCTLLWAPVGFFGGAWGSTIITPMIYNTDIGNNDEYKATITPPIGLYEFTTYCTDIGDNATTYQGAGNGRLVVDAASGGCISAAQGNNTVYYNGLLHDSFSTAYRNPGGPVPFTQGTVTLKFRTCLDDLNSAPSIRVWNDATDTETITPLTFDAHASDAALGGVTTWKIDLTLPTTSTILYYAFRATDGTASVYYRDDDPKFYGGGYGAAEANQTTAYNNSYQLTVYDPAFDVPEWMQRGVIYQIFPDRFRDGNTDNTPAAGRFSYAQAGGTITRSNQIDWNSAVCDPREAATTCTGKYGDNFYGGDLAGITDKINQGYFDNLGISVLYLNPIFRAPSNHKYDTADYLTIDPDFGTLADFQALTAAAHAHGMTVMLDGVFNHTSSDSKYFDRYGRFDAAGDLTDPDGGTFDGSGACEAVASAYRAWFYFSDLFSISNPGTDAGIPALCADNPPGRTYEAWYGYSSLPKLQANSGAVRNLIWNDGLNSVGPYWVSQGADAWRFDVGADVDPGLTNNPANDYWEGFRAAVRNSTVTGKSDVVMLGEEWGDASPWLLGHEWDSVMNYRFRSAVLSWLFTGCSGNGCTGGTLFQENDSNNNSSSGPIGYLSPSQFNARLRSIQEDYPPQAFNAMMNLEGSHDTNRVRYLLKKINNDNDAAALQRLKEWWLFAFTYAGAPTLYYGDEIALSHDAVWDGSTWQDDPYNRAPYPWPDEAGAAYSPVADTLQFARKMASIRWSYRALQDGAVQHGLIIDDANQLYGFARTTGTQTALIALNRSGSTHNATFTGLTAAPYNLADGTTLYDTIAGNTYTVSGGAVTVPVNATWGVVLLEQDQIDEPQAVTNLGVAVSGTDNVLSWRPVFADTTNEREVVAYQIHRGDSAAFAPDATTLIATVAPANFGTSTGAETYTDVDGAGNGYYYRVVPVNSAGRAAAGLPIDAAADNIALATVSASSVITFAGQAASVNFSALGGATYAGLQSFPDTPHPSANQNNGGAYMLARYYNLSTDGAGFNARLCLGYDQSEVGSLTENQLRLCRWTGAEWACYVRSAQSDVVNNVVCADNVTQFSDWTLGTVGPTAVTLNDLQAADRAISPIGWWLLAALALGALVLIRKRVIVSR